MTFHLDCFDVAADCRLVVGQILELDFLERQRCLVRDNYACDHGSHVTFVRGHSSRLAGEFSLREGAAKLFRSDPDGETNVSSRRDQLCALSYCPPSQHLAGTTTKPSA